jgi:hypothetical protein
MNLIVRRKQELRASLTKYLGYRRRAKPTCIVPQGVEMVCWAHSHIMLRHGFAKFKEVA